MNIHFIKNTKKLFLSALVAFAAAIFLMPQVAVAQDEEEKTPFDRSSVPTAGKKVEEFVPKGWVVEDEIKGDVTADGKEDILLKLIEDKPKKEDEMVDRNRVLVVLIRNDSGFQLGAVADRLLQCTACGGAFYGVMDAPADVTIEKGVIVAGEESGSRWVSNTTSKFRYDAASGKFLLIGFDYSSRDRAAGGFSSESTNYITSKRITEVEKGKRVTKKPSVIKKVTISLDDFDTDAFEGEALKRLGLD